MQNPLKLSKRVNGKNIAKVYFIYFFCAVSPQVFHIYTNIPLTLSIKISAILLFSTYMFLKYMHLKLNSTIVVMGVIYIIGQLVAYLLPSGSFYNESVITIIIPISIVFIMILTCLCIPASLLTSLSDIKWFVNAYILFVLFACLYSIIFDLDMILSCFSVTSAYLTNFSSFFDNKNTFAIFLYTGLIACVLQYSLTRKKRFILYSFIVFSFLLITFSRAGLYSAMVFMVAYSVLDFRNNKRLCLFTVVAMLVIGAIVFTNPVTREITLNLIIRPETGLANRDTIWADALRLVHGWQMLFGYGEGFVSAIMQKNTGNMYTHNVLILLLLSGGILKLLMYICVLGFVLKKMFYIYRVNSKLGSVVIASLISLLGYSMVEATVMLDTSAASLVITLFNVVLPLLLFNYCRNYEKNVCGDKSIMNLPSNL
jgi:O-antigen ligase